MSLKIKKASAEKSSARLPYLIYFKYLTAQPCAIDMQSNNKKLLNENVTLN
jgi:hypothetical protein